MASEARSSLEFAKGDFKTAGIKARLVTGSLQIASSKEAFPESTSRSPIVARGARCRLKEGLRSKKRNGRRGRGLALFWHRRRKPDNLVSFNSTVDVNCQLNRAHLFRVARERCLYHGPGEIMATGDHSRIV